ncbi:hypothetical protein [Aliarcobacter butzleri]|uniref:hypothetical protein n=1 Tax=Aliarcobacter butzleri TaxID=28197 RepID=UPI0018688AB9|nr:hypothetical protein [Aliarcobacter butzleri]
MVSKITAIIESVPIWGDDNFDANVHENFLKLKELGPQLNKTVDEINKTFEDIDTYTKTASNKAGEAVQSASTANSAKQTATQQAEIATTKAGEAAQSASTANSAKQTATQQAEIATTKAGEAAQSASTANSAKQTATQQAEIATTKAGEVNNIKNEMIVVIEALQSDPLSIIASQELAKKLNISDTQDLLTSNDTTKPLSANQGRVLKKIIDSILDDISKLDIIPKGIINMWSGAIINIPNGWALCNGQNGTPDLRDKFIVGAGTSYNVGSTGGSKDAIVVSHSHTQASHTHTATAAADGAHAHNIPTYNTGGIPGNAGRAATAGQANNPYDVSTSSVGTHTHTITNVAVSPTIASTGSSGTNANLPPYYALAFIIKI